MGEKMIRVLVAESSALDQERIMAVLRSDPEIEVVGGVSHSADVVEMVRRLRPDVIAMGTYLPTAGGFGATKEIMIEAPTPIIIVSDETDARQVEVSILALRAGALAVAPRPPASRSTESERRFIATVKGMARVKVVRHWRDPALRDPALRELPPSPPVSINGTSINGVRPQVIAIAASTGGPAALQQLLSSLPADFPVPILAVQHIADGFIDGLVSWLNGLCSLRVKVATHGESLQPHTVYMPPDTSHLGVMGQQRILLSYTDPVGGFRPSATFLFESVAKAFGASSMHVILTGMGQDGVAGLRIARAAGARILAQDEASSVVFGMPGAAIDAGVVDHVVPLSLVARELIAITRK